MFLQLKNEINLLNVKKPADLVVMLIKYFEKVGYFSKGEVEIKGENELWVYMHGATCHEAVVKLKSEGGYPPHFCTTLIFTGLQEIFNIKVELSHLDLGLKKPPYHTIEKWKLTKIN